jgi:hypothetical protein
MTEITNQTLHEILVRVESKVTKTNGRVTELECWQHEHKGALNTVRLLLVPIIVAVIMSFII